MSGCGGNCQCGARNNEPRTGTRLADALARTIVDNRVIVRTVELYELGVIRPEDLINQINAEKLLGEL